MYIIALGVLMWFAFLMFAVKNPIKGVPRGFRGGCGTQGESQAPPTTPTAESAIASSALLQELEKMYRSYIGQSIATPAEWNTQGDVYNQLLNYTPEQFAYPMEDIQKALASQQEIQLQDYLKQIRPTLAAQGQLDSTYYANMLGDYLKGQQSQSLTNTANLLSNQATQNYNLAQWLPQFKQSVAGSLGNLGQNKASLDQTNLMLPMNTYIPGLSNLYSMGQGTAQQQYQDALAQWQYNEEQAGKPTEWAMGLSKMMSIADPGGSYMGFYQNPEQTSGPSAQSMSGLGKAMELYSAWKGMGGGMGGQTGGLGGQTAQQYQYTPNTGANLSYYTPQTQSYGLNSNPNYGFNYNAPTYGYGNSNPYTSLYNSQWRY